VLSLPGSQVSGNISGNAANVTGTVAIANGGTGQTTQAAAITALAGTQTSGQYLRSNGTNTLLSAIQAADVPTLNQNTTGTAANITATSNSTLTTLSALSLPYSQLSGTVPTWNQNTTGTAANVTGTVAIANGGTGQTTQAAAITALTGTQTSGRYLRSDGTNAALSAIQAADVPTLNQNTTGTAANVTGTVAIANGGTGQTTASAAYNAITPITTTGDLVIGNGTNSATRLPIGTNNYVLTSNGTTAAWAAATGGGSSAYTRTSFTATAGQTAFTVTYAVGYLQVYVNGVLLATSDYTATSGTGFTLAVAASLNDIVEALVITTSVTGVTTGKSIAMALIFGF
jgi:hypothetical protein